MKQPKISVIIPCYNQEKYISECLNSVISQTFNDFEVIIVNDGSTDASLDIIKNYVNEYSFIHLIDQSNQGVVASRNNAINIAQGKYIYPLDADDKIAPNCLERLYTVIEQNVFDVVYSQTYFFGQKDGLFELELPDKHNMFNSNCVVCSALYRKSDWEKYGGYDEAMKHGYEDWEFWLNFIEDNKEFYRIDEVLFFYRCQQCSRNSTISRDNQKKLNEYVHKKHIKLFEYQPTLFIPWNKKIKLLFKKIFLSKTIYKYKKKKYTQEKFFYKNNNNPRLIMTLLVKNEGDILEQNLIFHKKMGVDGFIVTDNVSTDNTLDIIEKYRKKGWILEVIKEKSQDYSQVDWVHRMAIIAKSKYNADWIINADADEFWYPESQNIKKYLNIQNNKIFVPIYNMLSKNNDWILNTQKVVNNFPEKTKKQLKKEGRLSEFSQFSVSIPKVMVRASDYKMIHMGNHDADMMYNTEKYVTDKIQIYHYNIRGLDHFRNKMITGGAAFERNKKLGKDVGTHWRYFYEGFKNGTLDLKKEYLKTNGSLIKQEIDKCNIIQDDLNIKNFFERTIK